MLETPDPRPAFKARDILRLREAADDAGLSMLGDLIELAMWTGGRLDELCRLTVKDVQLDDDAGGTIRLPDGGPAGGRRVVPIHADFDAALAILCATSADGYIVEKLPANDDRDGKGYGPAERAFDRLKARFGFDARYTFDSIRQTVFEQLRHARVPEDVIADILGPRETTMSDKAPEQRTNLAARRDAIAALDYPLGAFRPRPPR